MKSLVASFMLPLLLSSIALAHPVTFEGGTALYLRASPKSTTFEANYTLQRHFALGMTYAKVISESFYIDAVFLQANFLLKRWNFEKAQANFYLSGGYGYGFERERSLSSQGLMATQIDFETDRFYTALNGRAFYQNGTWPYTLRYRIGFAPYLAEYKEVQSWLVLQSTYFPSLNPQPDLTLLMRFFYRNVLWEIGADTQGRPWLQLMVHL